MQSRCEGLKWVFFSDFNWLTACVGEVGSPRHLRRWSCTSRNAVLFFAILADHPALLVTVWFPPLIKRHPHGWQGRVAQPVGSHVKGKRPISWKAVVSCGELSWEDTFSTWQSDVGGQCCHKGGVLVVWGKVSECSKENLVQWVYLHNGTLEPRQNALWANIYADRQEQNNTFMKKLTKNEFARFTCKLPSDTTTKSLQTHKRCTHDHFAWISSKKDDSERNSEAPNQTKQDLQFDKKLNFPKHRSLPKPEQRHRSCPCLTTAELPPTQLFSHDMKPPTVLLFTDFQP